MIRFRFDNEVEIPTRGPVLHGNLSIPEEADSIVVFAHGSGSSRLSPRNMAVADYLNERRIGTLLFDLLTGEEAHHHYSMRFDINLLSGRLVDATRWLMHHPAFGDSETGFFGASTGAASALCAAAVLPEVKAVVSRGGRPDLAADALPQIQVPVLLMVGSLDEDVIELNKIAYDKLDCVKRLEIIPGAGHLFEEPGTFERVMENAAHWFEWHLHSLIY